MAARKRSGADDRRRAVIEGVTPEVDGGRWPIKRVLGARIEVGADVFADGHDVLRCVLRYRSEYAPDWTETDMQALVNDRWRGEFTADSLGRWYYTLSAWVDHFLTWRDAFVRRNDPADIAIALQTGAELVRATAVRASGADARRLRALATAMLGDRDEFDLEARSALAQSEELLELMLRYPNRRYATDYGRELAVVVDPPIAVFGAWYEMFPRSAAAEPGMHGTLLDCAACLGYVAAMGFDILYLPPIHPVGRVNRKGRNNTLQAAPDDVGSVWAIGSEHGGHKAIEPQLGTLEDFHSLLAAARAHNIEVALDIAFQCAPDHPYVREHPSWFKMRPDGSIQYAENPPKKYQDIYPFDFECVDWPALWEELKSVVDYWIEQGVKIFRVDNPHTKPFAFWEWLIGEVKRAHPEVIFLSEAFTRPKIMHRLSKLGFDQSYTYFTWRNSKQELTEYFTELTQHPSREYFKPNCWPNTPDILHAYLQQGGRPAFVTRFVLAATLCGNYGIYGPAFELHENHAIAPNSEEYLDSEKYQLRQWDLNATSSLRELIARINRIRRENAALQNDWSLHFFHIDNDQLLCYGKASADLSNVIVTAVNLDPVHVQSGWVDLDLGWLELEPDASYQMHDLLSGASYQWRGAHNYVKLDPAGVSAHVFRLERRPRKTSAEV